MPRLSLWKPHKGNDYAFTDRIAGENIRIGGVGVLVHKYEGPPGGEGILDIEDGVFLENPNREYSDTLYELRCTYTPNDVDYDLSQFGIFLSSDQMRFDFHFNDMMDAIGRKLISGDVLEFPNMRDTTLDGTALNKYFVVQDSLYSSTGYSQTWYPHLWKVRGKQMPVSSEYSDVIDKATSGDSAGGEGEGTGLMPPGWADMVDSNGNPGPGCNPGMKKALDLYCKFIDITDEIVSEAEDSVYYDPRFLEIPHIYIEIGPKGYPLISHWHTGDGIPPNGAPLRGIGSAFPEDMLDGEYFLRTDYKPDRLFQKQGSRFIKIEDDLRQYWKPENRRLETYIDNINITTMEDGTKQREKVAISKVIPQQKDQYAAHRVKTTADEKARQEIARKLDGADEG